MEHVERKYLIIILFLALLIHLMVLTPLLIQIFGQPFDLQKILEQKKEDAVLLQQDQAALKPKEALVIPEQIPTMPSQQPAPEIDDQQEEVENNLEEKIIEAKDNLQQKIEQQLENLPFSQAPGIPDTTPEKETPKEQQKQIKKKRIVKTPSVVGPNQNRVILPNFNQNFINYMQEGEDEYKRKGNENIRPDLEELKLISYHKKILQFINGACGKLRNQIGNVLLSNNVKRDLVFSYSIGSNGQLLETETIKSSGSMEVDNMFKEIFKSAAPFPQPPAHLRGKPLTERCYISKVVMDSAKYGNNSFSFYMGDRD